MVSLITRLIALVPLFLLLHLSESRALTHSVSKIVVSLRSSSLNVEKEISYDGVPAAVGEVEYTRIGGRKMAVPKESLGMINEEGVDNVNGEGSRLRNKSSRLRHLKVELIAGFIPLNADYHVPKPHPPKNN